MPKQKRQPQRTCIACRKTKDKRDLIRVVRTPQKEVIIDPTGKANGRGAYLCRQSHCWDKGMQTGRLAHALKVTVSAQELSALSACLQAEVTGA